MLVVALSDGKALRGDMVLKVVQRFDLVPIPSTVELVLRVDDSSAGLVAEGKELRCGTDRYVIVKARRQVSEWTQGKVASVVEVTGLLLGFEGLARCLPRAVIKEGKSLGEVYRSCGASARIVGDIPVARFAAFAGQYPTPSIAQAMQEECCAPVWRDGALSLVRLPDLFASRAVDAMAADTTLQVESGFLERHEVPWAMSTSPGGAIVAGRKGEGRGFVFLPRTGERVLRNMTRSLLVRRTSVGGLAAHIRAGDVISVGGVAHVVATAAHTMDSAGGDGASTQVTRLWLAEMSQ